MPTKPFSPAGVNLDLGTPVTVPSGSMSVRMKRVAYYNSSRLAVGSTYSVTIEWGKWAVEQGYAEDLSGILPYQDSPAGLSATETAAVQALVSGGGSYPGYTYANGTTLIDWTQTLSQSTGGGGSGASAALSGSAGLLFANTELLNTGTGASGAYAQVTATGMNFTLASDDILLLVADVTVGGNGGYLRASVSSTAFATGQLYQDHFFKIEHGSRVYIPFRMSDATATGGELISNTFNSVRILLNAGVTTGATATVHGVLLNAQARPKVLIEFDDNRLSQYTQAFRYMSKYNIPGTIAVIYNRVGTTNYMTLAQLREVYAAGWDLVAHGDNNHDVMASRAAVLADIKANRDYLLANGFTRGAYHYVLPGGIVSAANDTLGCLAEAGMLSARNVIGNPQSTARLGIDSKYGLWSRTISQSTTVATLLSKLDLAIDCQATQRMHGHEVVATVSDAALELSIADFKTLIDGVASRIYSGKLEAETVSRWASNVGLVA